MTLPVALFLLAAARAAAQFSSIAPTTPLISALQASRGSTQGGTFLTIWGAGFSMSGKQGMVTVFVGSSVCQLVEYYSSDTRLVCFTPPNLPAGSYPVQVQAVSIATQASSYSICAVAAGCVFTTNKANTPYIASASFGGYSGGGLVKVSGRLSGVDTSWYQIHVPADAGVPGVNGLRCDVEDELQRSPFALTDGGGAATVYCALGPTEAGAMNVSFEVRDPTRGTVNGFGQAQRSPFAVTLRGSTPVHLIVVPSITGVSVSTAGLRGGESLTVTGFGFSSAAGGNAVELPATDGSGARVWVPCAVTAESPTAITCVPGAAANSSPAASAWPLVPGGSTGLLHALWLKDAGELNAGGWLGTGNALSLPGSADYCTSTVPTCFGSGTRTPPSFSRLNADAVTGLFATFVPSTLGGAYQATNEAQPNKYVQTMRGFFVPPVSANYTFIVWSDDESAVYLSSDESPLNARRIAFAASYTLFHQYWDAAHVSAPLWLVAGKRYFFHAQHGQGVGQQFFHVGLRISLASNAAAAAMFSSPAQSVARAQPEVQMITTTLCSSGGSCGLGSIVREVQTITIAGATGQWYLAVGGVPLNAATPLDAAASADDVATALRLGGGSGGAFSSLRCPTVTRAPFTGSGATGFTYTITFTCSKLNSNPVALVTPVSLSLCKGGRCPRRHVRARRRRERPRQRLLFALVEWADGRLDPF